MFGAGALIASLFSGLTGKQQAAAGLAGVLVPIALLAGGFIHGNIQHNKGFDSRDAEVAGLVKKVEDLTKDLATANTDLSACRATNEAVSKTNRQLNSKIAAQDKAHIEALKAERENTAAARQATNIAVNALSNGRAGNSQAFAELKSDFERMLENAKDENGVPRCVVRGGKLLLRRARIGKEKE